MGLNDVEWGGKWSFMMFYDVWILSDSVGLNRDINDGKGALKSHGEGTMICWHC